MSLTCYFIQEKQGETKWKEETHDKNNKLGPFKTSPPGKEKQEMTGADLSFKIFLLIC